MKKKMILAIAAIMMLGLSIASFAYSTTPVSAKRTVSCCCCSGDSCPLKKKDANGKDAASCCDDCDCCKEGAESCPMKKKGEKPQAMSSEMRNAMTAEGEKDCCCSCCNKDKEKKDTSGV